ncbi:hypothetical protein MHU86_17982 [Fragilaria crotonensis]|nr:hypothetical protein MHU86_17982 [Fragilaria crotonensis]
MVDKRRVRGIFLLWILYLFLISKTHAQSNDDNLNQTPVAPTDDDSSPTSPNDPVAAPLFAPNAPEVPETPEPTQQEEDTPEPTPQEEDTPDPTPFEEETPEPTPFEQDTPEPTPFEEETPEPTPLEEDTPEPTPFLEDTPEPTPFAEDTPEPTPFAEDTSEPTPFVDDTPDPTPFEEETLEPTSREAETDNPTSEPTPWPTDLPTREPVSDPVPSPVAGPTDSPTSDLFTRPVASKTFSPTWQSVSSPVVFTTDGPTERQPGLSPGGIVTAGPSGQPERTPAPTSNPTSSPINDQTQVPSELPSTSSPIFDLNIDYVDSPEELWVVSLNNFLTTNELDKGNAVAVSPDGVLIYITRNRGRLDVHSAIDGSFRFTFTPPRAEPDYFPLECHSGVVFATLETAETTALYAIIDMPPRTENLTTSIVVEPTSRIVAIAHPYNELLWISEPLPGIIQGNPVVTRGAFLADSCLSRIIQIPRHRPTKRLVISPCSI